MLQILIGSSICISPISTSAPKRCSVYIQRSSQEQYMPTASISLFCLADLLTPQLASSQSATELDQFIADAL